MLSFLLAEPRDGLTLLNLQSSYLSSFSGLDEKFLGLLFFAFGMSQVLCQAPVGYLMENTKYKVHLLLLMAYLTVGLSILTVRYADSNPGLVILFKFIQGGVMTILPPALNALTLGLVGADEFSQQVTKNEMAAHAGTWLYNLIAGVYAFYAFGSVNVSNLFYLPIIPLVLFTGLAIYFMIISSSSSLRHSNFRIDENAACGTKLQTSNNDEEAKKQVEAMSFDTITHVQRPQATFFTRKNTPFMFFAAMCFAFHLVNAVALPLSMQVFAEVNIYGGDGDSGNNFLLSSMCIVLAQGMMVFVASKCGACDVIGRKFLFSLAIVILTFRCFILSFLVSALHSTIEQQAAEDDGENSNIFLKLLVLSMSLWDGAAVGIFNVIFIVITGDLAQGTGRFPFFVGVAATAVTLGGSVSGFVGEYLAEEIGYSKTFGAMGCVSTVILIVFVTFFEDTKVARIAPMAYFFPKTFGVKKINSGGPLAVDLENQKAFDDSALQSRNSMTSF